MSMATIRPSPTLALTAPWSFTTPKCPKASGCRLSTLPPRPTRGFPRRRTRPCSPCRRWCGSRSRNCGKRRRRSCPNRPKPPRRSSPEPTPRRRASATVWEMSMRALTRAAHYRRGLPLRASRTIISTIPSPICRSKSRSKCGVIHLNCICIAARRAVFSVLRGRSSPPPKRSVPVSPALRKTTAPLRGSSRRSSTASTAT